MMLPSKTPIFKESILTNTADDDAQQYRGVVLIFPNPKYFKSEPLLAHTRNVIEELERLTHNE